MVTTLSLTTEIPSNREVRITLPDTVPTGPAEIVIVVASRLEPLGYTLGDLLDSEFFGMWHARDDIGDSVEYARRLRAEAWSRPA
jgi:hypothetical protein